MNFREQIDKIKEKLPAVDEKYRYYILGGILVFIFLLDYLLIMQPQLHTLMTLGPKITLLAKDYKQAKIDIQHSGEYQNELLTYRKNQQKMGTRILRKEEIPTILENISRLAYASGVRINQIMPLKDSQKLVLSNEDGDYYALPVLVDAMAGYHQIGRFFNQIEKYRHAMVITDFEIAASTASRNYHALRMTINAYIVDKDKKTPKKK